MQITFQNRDLLQCCVWWKNAVTVWGISLKILVLVRSRQKWQKEADVKKSEKYLLQIYDGMPKNLVRLQIFQ